MKITLYGTAAAEGFPAVFCECSTCRRARKQGGRNLRTRSEALVDRSLLIDFGPDLLTHTMYSGLSLIPVTDVLLTHSHEDHLLPFNLWARCDGIGEIKGKTPLNIYGTKASIDLLKKEKERHGISDAVAVLHEIKPFEPFTAGRYEITPLAASHDSRSDPVIYLISDGKSTFFYCTDTGFFPPETKAYLAAHPTPVGAIAIDCTAGLQKGWTKHHLGLDTDQTVIAELRDLGVVNDATRVVLHHFSHNGRATYDDMVLRAGRVGFEVAYDGMSFKI